MIGGRVRIGHQDRRAPRRGELEDGAARASQDQVRGGEHVVLERQVDAAGTGDLDAGFVAQVGQLELAEQRLGDLTRRAAQGLAQAHGDVDLIVGAVRAAQQRVRVLIVGTEGARQGSRAA